MLFRGPTGQLLLNNTQTGSTAIKTHRTALSTTCHEQSFNYYPQVMQVQYEQQKEIHLPCQIVFFVSFISFFFFGRPKFQSDGRVTAPSFFPTIANSLSQNNNCSSEATHSASCAVVWKLNIFISNTFLVLDLEANIDQYCMSLSGR